MTWPKDKTDILIEMWCRGDKIGPIATRLKVSKNIAYSKVRRLGLPLHYKKRYSTKDRRVGAEDSSAPS